MNALSATLHAQDLKRFRAALDAAGYTRDNVHAALHSDQHLTAQPGEVIVFEHRLAGRSPVEILVKVFLLGSTVAAPDLEASLPSVSPAELERLGIIELIDGGAR